MQDDEQRRLRNLMGHFATGVTVVAARYGPLMAGMTANGIASISIDPPLLMASIAVKAETHAAIVGSHAFSVSVLTSEQMDLAECFARPTTAQKLTGFCGAAWHEAETGSPILDGALAYFDCRVTAEHPGGDHSMFLGAIVAAGFREDAQPLLWYGSRYHRAALDGPG